MKNKALSYSEIEIEKMVRDALGALNVESKVEEDTVPVGVSNRHVHLSPEHVETLFGKGYELTKSKNLSQTGQYACNETVTLVGSAMRIIEGVRVLGPARTFSQAEISRTDSYALKLNAPLRDSGDIKGSSPITILGPNGTVKLEEGCIVAGRHIHFSPEEAKKFGCRDGETVSVLARGERKTVYYGVKVRVDETFRLEFHIDTDESNAAGLKNGDRVTVMK